MNVALLIADAEATGAGAAWMLVGTVAGYLFGWLKDRDKLRYDKDFAEVKNQKAATEARLQRLEEEHAICREEAETAKRERKECMEKHDEMEKRHSEAMREIAAIKKFLKIPQDTPPTVGGDTTRRGNA